MEGQVLAVRPADGEVLIKHGDITGFMPAMTMPFKVKDPDLLGGPAPGDLVRAELRVGADEAWIASLDVRGHEPLDKAAPFPAAAFVRPLSAGDPLPATTLTVEDGSRLPLEAWRGSGLVVTFVYLRCPLPEFCPLMDRRFASMQRRIESDQRLKGRARLLSLSFDPAFDTPEQLRAQAARLGAIPEIWRFATAPIDAIDRVAATFGVNVIREADGTLTHNLRTIVVDPDLRVVNAYDGSGWTIEQVLDDLRGSLDRP
ncbi:MAG: copper-binding protein [Acidobacteriota bacterium]